LAPSECSSRPTRTGCRVPPQRALFFFEHAGLVLTRAFACGGLGLPIFLRSGAKPPTLTRRRRQASWGESASRETRKQTNSANNQKRALEKSELVPPRVTAAASLCFFMPTPSDCCSVRWHSLALNGHKQTPGRTGPPERGSWRAPRRPRRCWPGGGRPGSWRAARSLRCTSRTWRSPTSRRRCAVMLLSCFFCARTKVSAYVRV